MNAKKSEKNILIVSDSADELRSVHELLTADLGGCWSTDDESAALLLFQEHHPSVLILSFQEIEKAERFYLTLFRQCHQMQDIPHQTLLLCKNTEAESAYALCMSGTIDDYVVNRPLYDPFRLRLSVRQALDRRKEEQQSTSASRLLLNVGSDLRHLDNYVEKTLVAGEGQQGESLRVFQSFTKKVTNQLRQFEEHLGTPAMGHMVKVLDQGGLRRQFEQFHQESLELEILVVDDDEIYLDMLVTIVEGGGLRVVAAENGEVALAKMRTRRPDLVLLDYQMPGLDGLQTLRRMKLDPDLKPVPVIMLTGTSERELVGQCIQTGAADFIVKPSDRVTILAKINARLAQRAP